MVAGSVVAVGGVMVVLAGLTVPAILLVGLGAMALFIGVGTLAPIVVRPVASVLGRPLRGTRYPGATGR